LPDGVELWPTTHPGSAVDLARAAAEKGFARVVAAGGDGTAHEVANGLLAANRPEVVFSVWPVGSANDYAFTLGMGAWWESARDADQLLTLTADLGLIEAGDRRRYFVNNCGLGFNGMVTIEAGNIRYLRGVPLYTLAVLKSLVKHFAAPLMTLVIDGRETRLPTLAFSLGLGQREGGFPLVPLARLDDGWFDTIHLGDIRRWEMIRHLPGMMSGNLPTDHAKLVFGRCRCATVRGEQPISVHTDGEVFCAPSDGVRELTVSMLPGRLRVEYYPPAAYGGGRFDSLATRKDRVLTPGSP
jgi:diacylglycerol kinase family enzyme